MRIWYNLHNIHQFLKKNKSAAICRNHDRHITPLLTAMTHHRRILHFAALAFTEYAGSSGFLLNYARLSLRTSFDFLLAAVFLWRMPFA